jgi:ribosome-binding ATPase YchF (GTP1/OBG family)
VLEVGIVGPPGAGKTTLFRVLTGVEGGGGPESVGMAPVADERLDRVAEVEGAAKTTPAAIRVVDARGTGPAVLGNLRRVDALLAVVDGFSGTRDPDGEVESLRLELLVADRDHIERRLERVRTQAKSGDPALRGEVAELERLLAHVEAEGSPADYPGVLSPELEPLTTKPLLVIENGPGGIDLKLEAELAELPREEAAAFREGPAALDDVVRRLFEALDLITFFTANENEARASTLRRGKTALEAAAAIHSDLARGFIRCEVVRWRDLVEAGSRAEASRRGLQRVEGKTYLVEDGDVLNVRFNV